MTAPGSGTLHHTSFIVRDVDGTAARLSATVGIGPWHVWTIEPAEATLRGRPVSYAFRVALAEHGGSSYELLAPVSGHSVYVEHLETRGEGFHHTCHIFPTIEAMHAAKADLLAQGREMLQTGATGDLFEFCYFNVQETGAVLELLYLKALPPPERAIG